MSKRSENIRIVLETLKDEVKGRAAEVMKKLSADYTMTWVYGTEKKLFPQEKVNKVEHLEKVYAIKGRKYEIINIAEGKDVVMVELIESYPDPETKKVYRTPVVLVLEMKKGKIQTGRHYCDPKISYKHLTEAQVKKAFAKPKKTTVIK